MKNFNFNGYDFNLIKLKDQKDIELNKNIISDTIKKPVKVLLLLGKTGVGKTHIAKSCMNLFSDVFKIDMYGRIEIGVIFSGRKIYGDNYKTNISFLKADDLYYSFLYDQFLDHENKKEPICDLEEIEGLTLLVIDDLGIEKQTETGIFNEGFTKLLESKKPCLIITSNLTLMELDKRYGRKIFSRLVDDCQVIIFHGEDYRMRGFK